MVNEVLWKPRRISLGRTGFVTNNANNMAASMGSFRIKYSRIKYSPVAHATPQQTTKFETGLYLPLSLGSRRLIDFAENVENIRCGLILIYTLHCTVTGFNHAGY